MHLKNRKGGGGRLDQRGGLTVGGPEATETGLAYAPVSQAHGHNHIDHIDHIDRWGVGLPIKAE